MKLSKRVKHILSLSLVKDTLKLSSSNILLFFLPLLITPVLSRLYTPDDYGEWGIFSSVYMIVNYVLFMSYENAIVKSNDDNEIPDLCALCIIWAFGVIFSLCFLFGIGYVLNISFFTSYPRFDLLVLLLCVGCLQNLSNALANRFQYFGAMSISNIVNGFAQAGFRILFGMAAIVISGLIVGVVLAHTIAALVLIFTLREIIKVVNFKQISFSGIKRVAVQYKKFPLFDAPANLLKFASFQLVVIILALYFTRAEIGCYSMIHQFVLLPVSFVGSAISNVYYRKVSVVADIPSEIRKLTMQVGKITAGMCMLPALFLILGGDRFLVWFLGNQWTTAGMMALCMSISSIAIILTEALIPIYRTLNLQNIRFRFELFQLVFSLGGLIIVCAVSHNLYYSIHCDYKHY